MPLVMNFYVPFKEGYDNLKIKFLLRVPFDFDLYDAQMSV